MYRGSAVTEEKLEELKQGKNISYHKDNSYTILDAMYSSRKKIQSWTTNDIIAFNFAYDNAFNYVYNTPLKNKLIPIVIRAKISEAEVFFNPKFLNKLSSAGENEVLNITNPIKVDILVLLTERHPLYKKPKEINKLSFDCWCHLEKNFQ